MGVYEVKRMRKIMVVGLLTCLILSGCTAQAIETGSVAVEDAQALALENESNDIYYLAGRVKAAQSAEISVPFTGQICELFVQVGDHVQSGEAILRFESSEELARVEVANRAVELAIANYEKAQSGARSEQLDQAKSSLQSAQVNYENAKKDLERQQKLYDAGAVSDMALEAYRLKQASAESAFTNASKALEILEGGESASYMNVLQKQVDQANASLAVAQISLDKKTVYAPFDAVVTDIPVRTGESYLYKTTLVTLENQSGFTVDAYGPASATAHFEQGESVLVQVAECPDTRLQGTVDWIGNSIDAKRQDILVRVTIDAAPELMAGMFAEIAPLN
jgi:multidrug efflux pump subunit AcrA (membrane-fusion protein)